MGVEDKTDMSEVYNRFDEIMPFTMNTNPSITLNGEDAPWLLTRVNSTNVLDEGLKIGGKATTRVSGSEIGTRCTQVHVPTVEDRYILLAI
jgi:hypothetical protein